MTPQDEQTILARRAGFNARRVAEQAAELLRLADLDAAAATNRAHLHSTPANRDAQRAAQDRAINARVAFELAKVSAKRLSEFENEIAGETQEAPALKVAA